VQRMCGGQPYHTDQQNYVVDCHFASIEAPRALATKLEAIPGIAEHGLFIGYANAALVADGSEVKVITRGGTAYRAEDIKELP
jgi:ribose 5-phosphate isomerase A